MARLAGYYCSNRARFSDTYLGSLLKAMGTSYGGAAASIKSKSVESADRKVMFGLSVVDSQQPANFPQPLLTKASESYFYFDGYLDGIGEESFPASKSGAVFGALAAPLWEVDGNTFIERQKGTNIGVRFSAGTSQIQLYTDRFGVRKTYFYYNDGLFLFASEIKAILQHRQEAFSINRSVLARYLSFNYRMWLGRGETFFDQVSEMQPASLLTISADGLTQKRYWEPPRSLVPRDTDETALIAGFSSKLNAIVARDLQKSTKRLFMVSGGLDSPSIAATAARTLGEGVDCCAAVFPGFPEYDESAYITILTKKIARRTHIHEVEPASFLKQYETCLDRFDQPLFAANFLLNFQLLQLASGNGYDGVYGGGGGDRVAQGCLEYQLYLLADFREYGESRFNQEIEHYCQRLGPFSRYWPSKPEKVKEWITQLIETRPPGTILHNPDWVMADTSALGPELAAFRPVAPAIQEHYETYRQSRIAEDIFHQLDPVQNTFEDVASGMMPTQCFDPLWDKDLFEFGYRLPVSMLLNQGWTKYILRRAMDGVLPKELCWRAEKTGLGIPLNGWFRSPEMQKAFEAALESSPCFKTGLFNVTEIKRRFALHVSNEMNCGDFLWRIFCFSRWADRWTKGI